MVDRETQQSPFGVKGTRQAGFYGVIKSISMDTNADAYDRTDTHFLSGEHVASDARGSPKKVEKFIFSRILYHRRLLDVGIVFLRF